jgi:tRNA-specific 2-thiouridylase
VLCNRSIKFGHFAKWAFEHGADMIATGHYARIRENAGRFELLRAADANKDQSYFLYRLGQQDLSRTLFPIGEHTKPQVRSLAKEFGLPNAQRPDSQGLCFVGDVSMKDFLARFITLEKGNVVDIEGNVIGTHDGAALYTIGERHGFSASGSHAHYVVGVDIERNIVRVSVERADGAQHSVGISEVHWISEAPALPVSVQVQARYREKPFKVKIIRENNELVADFDEPRIAASGQSLVFYEGETCLGGGIINSRNK